LYAPPSGNIFRGVAKLQKATRTLEETFFPLQKYVVIQPAVNSRSTPASRYPIPIAMDGFLKIAAVLAS
jgi:hypothetical protein